MNEDWREALAPTPECVDIARFGGELTAAERAHLEECVRCQTELELFQEVMREETSPASQWISQKLAVGSGQWAAESTAHRPLPTAHSGVRRVLYAVAAALVILISANWWMTYRERSIHVDLTPGQYRSQAIEAIAPEGDLPAPPNELRWKPVPGATRYDVHIVDIEGAGLWSAHTAETHVTLPPDVMGYFKPGRTLLWTVTAYRGDEELTNSITQTVRVTP